VIKSASRKRVLNAEEPNLSRVDDNQATIRVSWLRVAIGVAVGIIGLLFIIRNVDFADVVSAFQDAILGYILLAVAVILVTILTKTWRWQLIFKSGPDFPGFRPLFWALVTGQFFNIVVPLRTGEIARVVSLDQQEHISKSKTVSTIVIEKTLDTAGLIAMMLVVLPFVTIPDEVSQRGNSLAVIILVVLPILFLLALNSHHLSRFSKGIGERLPIWMRTRFILVLEAGIEGLAALKSRRLTAGLSLITILIVILSLLTPLLLFKAFSLPFGIREAIIINLLVTLATAPPSTPGKIVVFLAIVRLAMEGFGIDDTSLILSYAIAFLIVVYAPALILGGLALSKGGYKSPFKVRRGEK
jgi:uncharacterized protein (TIRG00374 family)